MHNEGSKTGKHVHFVDGVPALQMDILNQLYLSSSYAKLQFKPQTPPWLTTILKVRRCFSS